MSSLVLLGAPGEYLLTGGGRVTLGSKLQSALAPTDLVMTSETDNVLRIVNLTGQPVQLQPVAYGSVSGSTAVLIATDGRTVECVGSERQPVLLIPIETENLVP